MLTLDSIAVLVDCWIDPADTSDSEFHKNILKYIDNTPEIKIIILASYDTYDADLVKNDSEHNLWYKNYRSLTDYSKRKQTSKVILNYVNADKLQIAMTTFEDFKRLLNEHEEIKNIYFMGHSWHQCIHHRPIGINSCMDLGKNIIVNQKYVFNAGTLLNMELTEPIGSYTKLKDDIYLVNRCS